MSDRYTASWQIVADLLRARTGQSLESGRMWRIPGALTGIFRQYKIANVDHLVCLLAEPDSEGLARDVVEALLNNETYFFRDKAIFDLIESHVLPGLYERRGAQKRLRIWSAGCSSGQELYSIAMVLREQRRKWEGWSVQLVGTDISQRIVHQARQGVFSQFEVQRGLTVAQMLEHFQQAPSGWQICPELRAMTDFRHHNLLDSLPREAPFDLVLCRNVLLYFDPRTRAQVFDKLRGGVAADGYLMLGAGETVLQQTELFQPVEGAQGLFGPVAPPTQGEAALTQARAAGI